MSNTTPKHISKAAQAVFSLLVSGLKIGSARKLDNAKGSFMAVHVDRLTERTYAIAHNYTQNGDRITDPDMMFWVDAIGRAYPCHYQDARSYQVGLTIVDDRPTKIVPAYQYDQAKFASVWMANIKQQQRLKTGPRAMGVVMDSIVYARGGV